jgi:hypothetical protein
MDETPATEIADAAGAIGAGLGVLTVQLFPFAMPALALVIAPLALLALPLLLLAVPLLLPLLLIRALRRRRGAQPSPTGPARTTVPSTAR